MSALIVPLLAAFVVIYALIKRVNVYEVFANAAMEGLPVLYRVLPFMAAMLIVIELLNASGLITLFTAVLRHPLSALGFPPELIPLALLRPFSGSASIAMVSDIIEKYGADSIMGVTSATMAGSSETIFYLLAMYFGAVGIQKTRFTLPVALIANVVSVIASVLICNLLFK